MNGFLLMWNTKLKESIIPIFMGIFNLQPKEHLRNGGPNLDTFYCLGIQSEYCCLVVKVLEFIMYVW